MLVVAGTNNDQQSNSAALYELVEGAGSTTGVFEGSLQNPFDTYSAFYPYDLFAGYDRSGIILFALPVENAVFTERNIANNANPMYGIGSTDTGIQLKNLCGILELPIKGEGSLVAISLECGQPLSGYFAVLGGDTTLYGLSGDSYPQYGFAEGEVTPAISLSSTPRSLYIILPPDTYQSLKITTFDSNGNSTSLTATNPITIERSCITVVSPFTHSATGGGGDDDSNLEDPQEKPEIDWR